MLPPTVARSANNQRTRSRRVSLALLCAALATGSGFQARAATDLTRPINFHIPAQPLDTALLEFSKQARIPVAINADILRQIVAPPVDGRLSAGKALSQLLNNTDLRYGTVGNMVTVGPALAGSAAILSGADNQLKVARTLGDPDSNVELAAEGGGTPASASSPPGMQEVVVSAEKRDERLQDVPVPVTAISADVLTNTNQVRLQDYYASVPGLSVAGDGFRAGIPTVAIRGITTGGYGNPTVGITIDDVPYGSSTLQGGGVYAPDIDPSDLQRVEVLRGPQGTLYGASSMGGLLKFVTVDPSTSELSGRIQGDVNTVHHGDGPGYGLRAAVNIPVTDTLAVRFSGFGRRDSGYVDNVLTGESGANRDTASGARVSALWRVPDLLTLKLSALYQDLKSHGSSEVDAFPGLGDLQQSVLPGVGGYDRKTEAYSATLNVTLGKSTLTSVSGYSINTLAGSDDYTSILGGTAQTDFGVAGAPFVDSNRTNKFTQEVRWAVPLGEQFDWLIGGFYDHESSKWDQNVFAQDPATGTIAGALLYGAFPTTYSEYAGFTDLTYHPTDRFDIQFGARESHNSQTYNPTLRGPLVGGTVVPAEEDSAASAFTYLFTPRYKITPDLMVYARLASGYRAGGPNTPGPDVPLQFKPDKTNNYELGLKGAALERALTFDASLYYIEWKSIQLPLARGFNSYTDNGSKAKSQGVELSVNWQPFRGLSVGSWVTFSDAELTQGFPVATTAYGMAGDRLPYSSRFSGHISVDDDFPVVADINGFVGVAMSYVGEREGVFTGTSTRQIYPAYAKTDLHGGLRMGSWTTSLYVNNVTDRRGLLSGGLGTTLPYAFSYVQPRTAGLTVVKEF